MNINIMKEWIELFKENNLTYLSVKDGEQEIVLSNQITLTQSSGHPNTKVIEQQNVVLDNENNDKQESTQSIVKDGHEITSNMIGTFYRAPGPGEEPFVRQGDQVKKGQVLCIIEAMKMMNEVRAKEDGVILKIYVANGEKVEYGQPLFLIK
ncbi:MAG: acetyl-CoA carboxylase biotin carboxyl carrier protein [Clostridiaceae bacterium]|nr:acetyl-CoA carboxylase biotin carboxyl carrier protein [Clostridiaceae bacterium]